LLLQTLQSTRSHAERLDQIYGRTTDSSHETVVYTDGACAGNGHSDATAGSGIYWGEDCADNVSVRTPGPGQTNNRAELFAVLQAVKAVPRYRTLRVFTDSTYVAEALVWLAPKHAAHGWSCPNGDIMREFVRVMRARTAAVFTAKVKGHSGNAHNDAADGLATEGARK
ncbi:ribonuclease H, partial [Exidia glandulosa HHB12029]